MNIYFILFNLVMSKVFMVTKVKEESVGKQEFKWETLKF